MFYLHSVIPVTDYRYIITLRLFIPICTPVELWDLSPCVLRAVGGSCASEYQSDAALFRRSRRDRTLSSGAISQSLSTSVGQAQTGTSAGLFEF